MDADKQRKQLDFIWLNGGADEQEEVLQLFLDLAEEVGAPVKQPANCQELYEMLRPKLDPARMKALTALLDDIARRITNARHRDITLI